MFADRAGMDRELAARRTALGPLTRGEINTSIIFGIAISLWMFPGAVELLTGGRNQAAQWMTVHLPEETVGILCGLMVFLLPVNFRTGTYTLTWQEAVRIDWGTIFLFAGGLALGTMIFDTGLAKAMGAGMSSWLGTPGLWTLAAAGIAFSLILSEATSNTATANVMVPIFVAMAVAGSLSPEPLALAVSLASSFGFMLPVSTGPNALAYGTGLIPLPRMIRTGFWLDIAGAISIWLVIRVLYA